MQPARYIHVLRISSSLWISILGWIGLTIFFIDLIASQQWDLLFTYAPGLGVAAWVLYFFFFAPKIRVGATQVEVRNVWTTTVIPYSRVDDITIGLLVKICYRDQNETACQITSWNAPGIPKPISSHRGANQGSTGIAGLGARSVSQVLVDAWQQAEDLAVTDPKIHSQVIKKLHWVELVVLGGLIVLVLLPRML